MEDKKLAWLNTEIKSPPFSLDARQEAGMLLRRLQRGENIGMPESRPLPQIAPRLHELRIKDDMKRKIWRIFYRIDPDFIVVAAVEEKKTEAISKKTANLIKRRLKDYDTE
jgi:phage-related protein